ncbi:MAG: DUF2061 domain-containing protein [Kiritimatiellae bacterium]|nr:DUF2061 domain-containing protein [Kiritimatiellia bacterium]
MKESHTRTLVKAISWRVTASITTTLITYFVTGSIKSAFSIGAFDLVIKFVLYYLHERLWIKIPLGQHNYIPEYEI